MATIVFDALAAPTEITTAEYDTLLGRFNVRVDAVEGDTINERVTVSLTASDIDHSFDNATLRFLVATTFVEGDTLWIPLSVEGGFVEGILITEVSLLPVWVRVALLADESSATYDTLLATPAMAAALREGDSFSAAIRFTADVADGEWLSNHMGVYMTAGYAYGYSPEHLAAASDDLQLSSELNATLVSVIADTLIASGYCSTQLDGAMSVADTLSLRDTLVNVFSAVLSDSVTVNDALTSNRLSTLEALDALMLSGAFTSFRSVIGAMTDALTYVESVRVGDVVSINDTLGMSGSVEARRAAIASLLDSLVLDDAVALQTLAAFAVSDTMRLDDGVSVTAMLRAVIEDEVSFVARLTLAGEPYTAYSFNTQSLGYSTYDGFNFSSFAVVQGQLYATAEDGLYIVGEDDTDNGEAIKTRIRTGLINFGTRAMKRVPSAYLGIDARGVVVLKAIVTSASGVKESHWYTVTPTDTGALRERRAKIGRGLRSVYWAFELATYDGEDFMLDGIELHSINLERRV